MTLLLLLLFDCNDEEERRFRFIIPIIGVALWTTALICYDEFVFHRQRCSTHETWLHRMTVFGNGAAWLAWVHYCFVAEVPHVS